MQPILASASFDGTIRFWDLHSGNSFDNIAQKESQVNAMAISSDGTLMAVACWQSLKLIDLYKKTASGSNDSLVRNVTSLCFVPESSRLITGGEDQRIRLWNTRGGQPHCEKIFELPAVVNSVCVLPNQTTVIATDGQGGGYQWDTRSHQYSSIPLSGMNFGEHIISVAASPVGNKVAGATNQGRLLTWDVSVDSKPEVVAVPNQRSMPIPVNLTEKKPILAHSTYITHVRFTPNGERIATTSADGSVCLWDPNNLENERPLSRFVDDSQVNPVGWVWDCAFTTSANSKYMISASADGILRLWDVPSERVKMYFRGHNKPITAMAFRDVF
uniref:Target of rapamycin complex subunit lst8 n=1 Tax=Steinernema glaseri TaxID=37863 RepID=A0A1I7Y6Q9_9BILA